MQCHDHNSIKLVLKDKNISHSVMKHSEDDAAVTDFLLLPFNVLINQRGKRGNSEFSGVF